MSELMDAMHSAKETELHAAKSMWAEKTLTMTKSLKCIAAAARTQRTSSCRSPGAPGHKVLTMPEDEFGTALRTRLRIPYLPYMPRFRRERGTAQHWDHQYSTGCTICGHIPIRADSTADVMGKHQQLCKAGGGVDRRHNCFRKGVCSWLVNVCSVPCVDIGRHVPEWVQ